MPTVLNIQLTKKALMNRFIHRAMDGNKKLRPDPDGKLMDQVRETLRYYHYAYRTEQTSCMWIKRYLRYHDFKRHSRDMGAAEVERFLSHLASKGFFVLRYSALDQIYFCLRFGGPLKH